MYQIELALPLSPPSQLDRIVGDGNCFYRALSLELCGTQRHHGHLKELLVDFMLDNKDSFVGYVGGDLGRYLLQNTMRERSWGSDVEIFATATLLQTTQPPRLPRESGCPIVLFSGSQMFPISRRRSVLATCAGTSSECPVPFEPSVFSFRSSFPGSGTRLAGLRSGFVPFAMQWLDSLRLCRIDFQFTIVMFCIIN